MFKWRMLPTETAPPRLRDDYMFLTGCALLTGIVLYLAGELIQAFNLSKGASGQIRLELIAGNFANILTAGVLLAAAIALMHVLADNKYRVRPIAVLIVVLAGVVVAFAVYQVFDILTMHIANDASDAVSFTVNDSGSFSSRLARVLPALGTLVVATVALLGAVRLGNVFDGISGNRGTSGDLQEIPEVE